MSRSRAGLARRGVFFRRQNGASVKISPSALEMLLACRQMDADACEAGGILIGRELDSGDVIIDGVTTPQPGDVRRPMFFHRSQAAHQAASDRAYEESNGRRCYVGEWHTHAEPSPTPSAMDMADWQRRLREDEGEPRVFFAIIGQEEIALWDGNRITYEIVRLNPRELLWTTKTVNTS